MATREREGNVTMTTTVSKLAAKRPSGSKLPPASGRPTGKGLESITRGEEAQSVKRVPGRSARKGKP